MLLAHLSKFRFPLRVKKMWPNVTEMIQYGRDGLRNKWEKALSLSVTTLLSKYLISASLASAEIFKTQGERREGIAAAAGLPAAAAETGAGQISQQSAKNWENW